MTDKDSLYAALLDTYHDSLKNFCISKGVRSEDIDDIVSEAFTCAIAHADVVTTLQPKQQRAWLYSAVVRIMKDYPREGWIFPSAKLKI